MNIRVVTFLVNQPGYAVALKYFMAAWRINAGDYYARVRFTIMLPAVVDEALVVAVKELILDCPVDLVQVSTKVADSYQYYWPMSFLDATYNEDLVVFSPLSVLVTKDISRVVEYAYTENTVVAPVYSGADTNQPNASRLSTRFMVLPKSSRNRMVDQFLPKLSQLGFPAYPPPGYHASLDMLAHAFAVLLAEQQLKSSPVDGQYFYEFGRTAQSDIDFDEVVFYSVTDAPESKRPWNSLLHDTSMLQGFLDNSESTGAWLYFQRELRRIHNSFAKASLVLTQRNLFQTTCSPYYIYGLDFMQQSAGIRALHYLCHALNESGQEAYITCENISPQLRTPVLTEAVLMQHYAAGRKPIMVYPEIVSGDPMAVGGVVVRWLLNQAGHIGGDDEFAAEDIIFAYDDQHLTQDVRGEILHIPTSNIAIFNNDDNPYDDARDLVCYYAHKYLHNGGQLTEQVQGAISLCKDQVLTHAEIAAILRRAKLLYVYESTSLIEEALLCGCPVSVIETNYWRNNMANYAYTGDIGVVMDDSPESIALATANVHKYRELHENVVVRDAWRQIDRFVEITQNAAKLKAQHS
jgi:hypothetical protein